MSKLRALRKLDRERPQSQQQGKCPRLGCEPSPNETKAGVLHSYAPAGTADTAAIIFLAVFVLASHSPFLDHFDLFHRSAAPGMASVLIPTLCPNLNFRLS
jgi:hypothetical protein